MGRYAGDSQAGEMDEEGVLREILAEWGAPEEMTREVLECARHLRRGAASDAGAPEPPEPSSTDSPRGRG
jgi:hypothetical protein